VAIDGAKGVGEGTTIADYATIINAINDALSQVRPGAQVNIAPATPDSILVALSSKQAESPPET
jgi:CO/xanthine dehydrogenase Mo-binding subunit